MKIFLNGQPREIAANDVASLVAELGFAKGTVLIERNGTALRPDEWTQPLAPNDQIELLRIVAGG